MAVLDAARAKLLRWKTDPAAMVREEFGVEPDAWQLEALAAFARPTVQRLAFKACKGPGKTGCLAWCILNFLATRPHCRIGCTSISEDNLATNLWPELAKWMNRSLFFREAFVWTKTRVVCREAPEQWFVVARAWPRHADPERQAEVLAGLHADHVMFVLDESGGIPQAVMVTAEAVLATEGSEGKVLQAGNPTHTTGPLYRACTQDRHLWDVITITGDPDDPRRSPRISLQWAREQIQQYGRDNPWVKVNVLGEFPPTSINALLGVDEVEAAMRRHLQPHAYEWAQKRIGVDVARFGDDRTVLFPRQGVAAFRPVVLRVQRTTAIAARVAKGLVRWGAELVLIDDTGHWGHGVVDALLTAGYPCVPIIASDPAVDPRYKNRRAEMWLEMAKWVQAGGALPNLPDLVRELTVPTYTFLGGKFVLEDKDQIKARLGSSPDLADALAQTFALPDQPAQLMAGLRTAASVRYDGDPFAIERRGPSPPRELTPWPEVL
jgi:phage terminase large subunit